MRLEARTRVIVAHNGPVRHLKQVCSTVAVVHPCNSSWHHQKFLVVLTHRSHGTGVQSLQSRGTIDQEVSTAVELASLPIC